jgi:YfiH family protein
MDKQEMSPALILAARNNNRQVFPAFASPGTFHGTFTRLGGVSPAPFDSFNIAFGLADDGRNVRENRGRIKASLGIKVLVSGRQVHGAKVAVIAEKPAADLEVDGCDALITDAAGIGLMIQHADCQAILLDDPVNKAVGIVHAGWRGSVANIALKTVEAMMKSYNTDAADLKAAISPSLGPCCAEFINYQQELPAAFFKYQVRPNHFDFWAISRDQLRRAGIRSENIAVANQCTVCNPDYFSYRRDKITGRCASVIGIRK